MSNTDYDLTLFAVIQEEHCAVSWNLFDYRVVAKRFNSDRDLDFIDETQFDSVLSYDS